MGVQAGEPSLEFFWRLVFWLLGRDRSENYVGHHRHALRLIGVIVPIAAIVIWALYYR